SGPGAVIFVEHPPVVTLGRTGRRDSLLISDGELATAGIDLVHSDRGGDITYHGPGQLVVYPILNLGLWKKDVHRYLRSLEEVALHTLSSLGIAGHRSPLGAGVWARHIQGDSRKIASLGIHLSRWITSHGLALNVSNSLEPFRYLVPCGLANVRMTTVSELLGRTIAREPVERIFWTHLSGQFNLRLIPAAVTAPAEPVTNTG
ncbi:MAG: lipoyl(octanoyl) transferase LipB, partial [Acidobacteria bacterium]|nr:lipoyl(octanoyl) transferase LipB [Acidobacteriota bacterium]